MSDDLVIQGSLENTTLPELLRSVCSSRETGELTFSFLDTVKKIFILDGKIVFASSNNPDDRLGEILIKRDEITVEQYLKSVELIGPGKKQGQILCDLGYLTPEDILEGVKFQVREVLNSLFLWTKGNYSLELKEIDTTDLVALNMSTEDIIVEGIKKINGWSRIFRAVGGLDTVLIKKEGGDQLVSNVSLSEEELHVYNCISGKVSVKQVLDMSYLNNIDTYKILWAMKAIEAVGEVQVTEQDDLMSTEDEYEIQEIVDKYSSFFSFIYDYFKEHVGSRTVELLNQSIKDVRPQYPVVLADVDLSTGGFIDFDQIYTNLVGHPVKARKPMLQAAFNELMYNLVFVSKKELGDDAEKVVSARIREIKESSGL